MLKFVRMQNNNLYTQIKKVLAKEPKILAAYIIGSTVSGKTSSKSDFDLAVIVQNKKITSEDKVYELVRDIRFPRDLDMSVIDKSSSPIFLYEIVAKGKRIYQKSKVQINNFEAFVLHNYYDTAHMRSIFENQLKQKISSYAN